jgi:NNP family nitrate/nitrite transporter-like MFS transporter
MALAAVTAGLGGGNFASSMANISFFFPDREKGWALGLNAAGGNIGVSTVQLVVPLVIGAGAAGGALHLANAALVWAPCVVVAIAGALFFMDNLAQATSSFRAQIAVARSKHTWILAWLYIGVFGSFVGYSAAFPLLLKTQFPWVTANLAFLGPLVGSLARPVGGKLADRYGGARVSVATFAAMATATGAVVACLAYRSFPAFLAAFLVLFASSGIGNGSVFRMVPTIFREKRDTAAVLGLTSAVGALGAFFIPQGFSASIHATGAPTAAFATFLTFYATCLVLTWRLYLRTAATGAAAATAATATTTAATSSDSAALAEVNG